MVASCAHAVPAMAQQISDSANDFLQYMLGLLVVDFTSLTSLAVAAPPQQFNLVVIRILDREECCQKLVATVGLPAAQFQAATSGPGVGA
jgi:hypothetical protein